MRLGQPIFAASRFRIPLLRHNFARDQHVSELRTPFDWAGAPQQIVASRVLDLERSTLIV
jgi:hypothetical protein